MDEKQREWEKNKCGLILAVIREKFEETAFDYITGDSWSTIEELDGWVDSNLREYEDARKVVRDFYNRRIYQ